MITTDLDLQRYQGFFDIPVDNLYGKPLLQRYIERSIPGFRDAVIVSPDAGGAKRATAIADNLGLSFALIHKVGLNAPGAQGGTNFCIRSVAQPRSRTDRTLP